jgi:serine/threonine protein kinase
MTSPPESSDGARYELPRPGDLLARKYQVKEALGAGGMGVVLLVEHVELGQRMAIKMMAPGGAHDERAKARFLREARAAAGLASEHVVRIFDVGTLETGLPYMVMELLRGEDLSRVLQAAERLPISRAVDYVLQACHAIAEAHSLGIVHRDLKPANLFLTFRSDGSALIKVLDFGISKAIADSGSGEASANLTGASAVMGSPLYMSPEQVRNSGQVDGRTDVWSLGVILFELLTGLPAFQADTVPGICAAIAADDPPLLSSHLEDAPPELQRIVDRCLEKNVTRRFQSVTDLMTALRSFAPTTSRPPSTPLLVQTMPEAGSSPHLTSGRRSGRPELSKVASGSAVTFASLATPPAERAHRPRLALFAAGVVLAGIGAGFGLASLRHPDRVVSPPVVPGSAESGAEKPTGFVLLIDSEPAGASVREGNQKLGTTPARISVENEEARHGPRKLSVERDGFLPYSIVQGPSDHDVHIVAVLEPSAGKPSVASAAPPPLAAAVPRMVKLERPTMPPARTSAELSRAAPSPPVNSATSDIRLQR